MPFDKRHGRVQKIFSWLPCAKGVVSRRLTEGLSPAVLTTDSPKIGACLGFCCTILPVRLTPNHLPLHKGGENLIFTLLFLFPSARVVTLATPSALRATYPRRGSASRQRFRIGVPIFVRRNARDFLSLSRLTPTAPSSEGAKGMPLFCAAPPLGAPSRGAGGRKAD